MFLSEAEILLPPWEVGLTGHFGLQPGDASDSRPESPRVDLTIAPLVLGLSRFGGVGCIV